jgi:hypothetical protein
LKKKVLGLTLLTIMLAMPMMISSVGATEWVEVARQSGSAFPDPKEFSMQFECSHVEWRIRWSYDAVGSPFESVLLIQKSGDLTVYSESYLSKSGVRNIHNEAGNFSLEITCINMYEYTIIIEEDVDSIPEFTTATLAIVLVAVSVLAVALSKKVEKRR